MDARGSGAGPMAAQASNRKRQLRKGIRTTPSRSGAGGASRCGTSVASPASTDGATSSTGGSGRSAQCSLLYSKPFSMVGFTTVKRFLVTGGAGFIGSAVVRTLIRDTPHQVLVVDKLTYAGNLDSLKPVANNPRYAFERADIADRRADARGRPELTQPDVIMHLAAESHVDRSIDGPGEFIQTNVVGTYTPAPGGARPTGAALSPERQAAFRFHHISTDEVFGSLGDEASSTRNTPTSRSSPYSASKAASDHFVRAWHHTYGLPTLVTNCSNNYGPYHFPEKLIPLMILNALEGKPLPVYGKGENVRDWLYVEDHARALILAAEQGRPGETYAIGGHNERRNIDVVRAICALVDELAPERCHRPARAI